MHDLTSSVFVLLMQTAFFPLGLHKVRGPTPGSLKMKLTISSALSTLTRNTWPSRPRNHSSRDYGDGYPRGGKMALIPISSKKKDQGRRMRKLRCLPLRYQLLRSRRHGLNQARRSDTRPPGRITVKAEKNLVKCGVDTGVD